jgi:hypothetical protein
MATLFLSIAENLLFLSGTGQKHNITPPLKVYDRVGPLNPAQWDALQFVPGRDLQSAELNDMQSIVEYYNRLHIEAIHKEGDVVVGCGIEIVGTSVQIAPGRIFINGKIREVPGTPQPLTIDAIGAETIGVKYAIRTVTEMEDNTLLDPAEDFEDFQQPGAYRRKVDLVWSVNDATALTIYTLQDGVVATAPLDPEVSNLAKTLARRTYNESGHYLVGEMNSSIDSSDAQNVYLKIPPYAAVVMGYEVVNYVGARVTIPIAHDPQNVVNEPHTYMTGTERYLLNGSPSGVVNEITATVQVTANIQRGGVPNTSDLLPFTPVSAIISVSQGGTTYISGADYVRNGDSVDWSPLGAEPVGGTTYTVTWRYIKLMVMGERTLTQIASESRTKAAGDVDPLTLPDGASIIKIADNAVDLDNPNVNPYSNGGDYELRLTAAGGSEVYWLTATRPGTGNAFFVRYNYWAHTVEGDYVVRNSFSDVNDPSVVTGLPRTGPGLVTTNGVEANFTSPHGMVQGDLLRVLTGTNSGLDRRVDIVVTPTQVLLDRSFPANAISATWKSIEARRDYVDFRPAGDQPVSGEDFTAEYYFYLSKWYITTLNSDGQVIVIPGAPARENPVIPVPPTNLLPLQKLYAPADSAAMEITELGVVAVTMARLNSLIRRVGRAEYNLLQEDLDREADAREQSTTKIGAFTDGFIGRTKMDTFAPGFDVGIAPGGFEGGELVLPRTYQQPDVLYDAPSSTAKIWATSISLPGSEYFLVEQPYKTDERIVNRAIALIRPTTSLNAEPHEDIWVDYDITAELQVTQNNMLWLNQNVIQPPNGTLNPLVNATQLAMMQESIRAASQTVTHRDKPAEFCRIRTVRLFGSGFAFSDKIEVWFNARTNPQTGQLEGVKVKLTPIAPTTVDGTGFLVTPNTQDGSWIADFTIPPNIPAGSVPIVAWGISTQMATTLYLANGSQRTFDIRTTLNLQRLQILETCPGSNWHNRAQIAVINALVTGQITSAQLNDANTIDAITPPGTASYAQLVGFGDIKRIKALWDAGNIAGLADYSQKLCAGADPVMETFSFPEDRILIGIDLMFSAKPTDPDNFNNSLVVRCGKSGPKGLDGENILGRVVKYPSSIPLENFVRFNFPDPIHLEANQEYGVMVYSASADWKIRVAEQGKFDIANPTQLVGLNPYINGVFQYSTNGTVWSTEQDVDLTMRLIGLKFPANSPVRGQWQQINLNPACQRFAVQATVIVPEGSRADWFHSVNGSPNFSGMELGPENKFGQNATSTILRAEMVTTNELVTPIISHKTLYYQGITNKTSGRYVNRTITFPEVYQNVTVYLQIDRLDPITSWKIFLSIDGGATYQPLPDGMVAVSSRIISDDFRELRYEFDWGITTTSFKMRIDYSTSDPVVEPRARNLIVIQND